MDPNQSGIPQQRTDNADPIGADQGINLPIGSANVSGINDLTQILQAPSAGVPPPDRSGPRVWSRTGDRSPIDSSLTRTQPIRLISPIQITQAREEVAELRGTVRALLDKAQEQEIAHRAITTRLEQTEREFAEHRASI
ncbi:Uncharacterized protein Rs2_29130 [Raphanus sativus]|nr:Uncharacterized protein Rs2_29130 [Raphanus sativus]